MRSISKKKRKKEKQEEDGGKRREGGTGRGREKRRGGDKRGGEWRGGNGRGGEGRKEKRQKLIQIIPVCGCIYVKGMATCTAALSVLTGTGSVKRWGCLRGLGLNVSIA